MRHKRFRKKSREFGRLMPHEKMDFSSLETQRTRHPAWRLLRSDHAPLVANFLHRVFIAQNVHVMPAADLAEARDDQLYTLRLQLGEEAFPKAAMEYLND
jgi:hypothetical protein